MTNIEDNYSSQLNQERRQLAQKEKTKNKGLGKEITVNIAEFLMLLLLAIAVDTVDWLDLTGFGAIISRIIDLPALGLLWTWRIMKVIDRPGKAKTKASFKIILFFLCEISPIGLFPFWTAYIIYTWLGEKKASKVSKIIKSKKVKKLAKI